MFTRIYHQLLPRVTWIQDTPSHPINFRYTLILSSHLWLPSELFDSGYLSITLYAFFLPPCIWHHCPPPPQEFLILIIITKNTDYDDSCIQFFPTSCNFYPPRSKYFPQHPVPKLLNSCRSLHVREDSYSYESTDKIIIGSCILFDLHIFWIAYGKTKVSELNGNMHSPNVIWF
jgi:hypothetical protein